MERTLIDDLKWELTPDEAIKALRISEEDMDEFLPIYSECVKRIAPLAYYARADVENNDGHTLAIAGTVFSSRVLSVNLSNSAEVYPYVITSGRAAYEYARGLGDPIYSYWADTLCELALRGASADAAERVRARHELEAIYAMNPGSLPDWPISQQAPLFELLGDVYEKIGVKLTPSYLMLPVKSVSGIWFTSKEHYVNCSMCQRRECPSRRAPYDEHAFLNKYAQ